MKNLPLAGRNLETDNRRRLQRLCVSAGGIKGSVCFIHGLKCVCRTQESEGMMGGGHDHMLAATYLQCSVTDYTITLVPGRFFMVLIYGYSLLLAFFCCCCFTVPWWTVKLTHIQRESHRNLVTYRVREKMSASSCYVCELLIHCSLTESAVCVFQTAGCSWKSWDRKCRLNLLVEAQTAVYVLLYCLWLISTWCSCFKWALCV